MEKEELDASSSSRSGDGRVLNLTRCQIRYTESRHCLFHPSQPRDPPVLYKYIPEMEQKSLKTHVRVSSHVYGPIEYL
jgi:hypothetical protein